MRITNRTILRGYNRDLNRLLTLKNQSERKITSNRRFSRASEAPLAAAKALNVRKALYNSAQYRENLKTADKFYTEAETSLLQVSLKMAEIRETIIAACNTTKDIQDYNIYAQQLETSAKELCAIFNTDSAERAIFGGESDAASPFTIVNDSSGFPSTVLYHGVPVNAMDNYRNFPYSKDVVIDIGIGMEMNQETQEVDPQSTLRISFNGAKVSGCGAESGVADIDLSSIQSNANYCVDVYAGNVKKTIQFKGGEDYNATVDNIQKELDYAYRKEIEDGTIKRPIIDKQGVVSVEDGICCVVNNEVKNVRAAKLVVDNDSGYTNKYKLNVDALSEGQQYAIDVTVGDNKPVTVVFTAGTDPDPEVRGSETIKNIQAALDGVFGDDPKDRVSISESEATKGIFSAEGNSVKVEMKNEAASPSDPDKLAITSVSTMKYDPDSFSAGTYSFKIPGVNDPVVVTLADGENINDKFNAAAAGYKMNASGVITKADDSPITGVVCTNTKNKDGEDVNKTVSSSHKVDYSMDLNALESGKEYGIKVVYGNSTRDITFTAGADAAETKANLQAALDKQFGAGTVAMADDGGVVTFGSNDTSKSVAVATKSATDTSKLVERERIFSNNYIQLTLDAARALREGDIEYANGCIDRIVSANENLLVEIADLGCNEEFISFNLDRLTTREENLSERQNDLEVVDAKSEITLWKTYEALYNACLQMSSSVVPNSIFNYIS
ncbi:MAG: hypothetical protein NC401_17340 [Ruminococcus sp.]|nr:hypothetical protein [Ruminococcus sp.]